MPYRQGTFREKFTTHELSKLEFRKINGYYFAKKNRQDPEYSWMLIKDDTSAVIKFLCYVKATKEQLTEFMEGHTRMKLQAFIKIFNPEIYNHPENLHTMEDLEDAVIDLHYTLGADALKQSFDKVIGIHSEKGPIFPPFIGTRKECLAKMAEFDINNVAKGLMESPVVKYGSELKRIDLSQIGKI